MKTTTDFSNYNGKNKKKESFIEFILFNPKSFNLLMSMSLIIALVISFSLTVLFVTMSNHTLTIIFSAMSVLSVFNLYKNKKIFKVWNKNLNEEEYLNFTVADTLNTLSNKKYYEIDNVEKMKDLEKEEE